MTTFKKRPIGQRICTECSSLFYYYDIKTKVCRECREREDLCKCGCGEYVKVYNRLGYKKGHKTKGKTYMEIYGTNNPACGFKKGEDNQAKTLEVRKKISKGLKKNYKDHPEVKQKKVESRRKTFLLKKPFHIGSLKSADKQGRLFRSKLESKFSNFLLDNNINYEYEKAYRLKDNTLKFVDFVIDDIAIEITGYAYLKWQEDFKSKISLLHHTYPDLQIINLTYEDKEELLRKDLNTECDCNTYTTCITNTNRFLSLLNFCRNTNEINKLLNGDIQNGK